MSMSTHILVTNSKGGCGKTTVATNLAVGLQVQGKEVVLWDYDIQGSSILWSHNRITASEENPRIKPLKVVACNSSKPGKETLSFQRYKYESAPFIIIDATAGKIPDSELERLIRISDMFIVPAMSSSFDIKATERFLTGLLTHRLYRSKPRPVGLLENRSIGGRDTSDGFLSFLACIDIPKIAELKDSPIYQEAADAGLGIAEMGDTRAAQREYKSWKQVLAWVENQGTEESRKPPRKAPRVPGSASSSEIALTKREAG